MGPLRVSAKTMRPSHPAPQTGFHLLELMAVLLILGVILTLALPGYRRHMLAAHRAEAVQALSALHLAQERYRSTQPRYAASTEALSQPPLSPQGRYRLSVTQASPDGFVLEAQAVGEQAADLPCQRLRIILAQGQLSQEGSGAGGSPSTTCWPQ